MVNCVGEERADDAIFKLVGRRGGGWRHLSPETCMNASWALRRCDKETLYCAARLRDHRAALTSGCLYDYDDPLVWYPTWRCARFRPVLPYGSHCDGIGLVAPYEQLGRIERNPLL